MFLRPTRISAGAILAAMLAGTPASADSLPELWKRPVRASYDTPKSALSLEHCIGVAVSDWGSPSVLHGEGVTEIWVTPPYAIRITDAGASRTVKFNATGTYDDRVNGAIKGCL